MKIYHSKCTHNPDIILLAISFFNLYNNLYALNDKTFIAILYFMATRFLRLLVSDIPSRCCLQDALTTLQPSLATSHIDTLRNKTMFLCAKFRFTIQSKLGHSDIKISLNDVHL